LVDATQLERHASARPANRYLMVAPLMVAIEHQC
jgi:hypothetical protein